MTAARFPGAAVMNATAYSYVRFSTPEQAEGDSLRRQTEAAAAWCGRHGVRLDETTTLRDLRQSAYTGAHRKNPDRHALAAFLKLVERGKVPTGSYLIIENLDRLSREDERAALRLWMDLLDAGVNIVQLQPETVFRHEKSDMFDIMRAVMELSRGHGESARKSERNGASWRNKVEMARQSGGKAQPPRKKDRRACEAITDQLPAWVEIRGGKKVLIPERVAVVQRIFRLAAVQGIAATVAQLTAEKVPTFGERVPVLDADGNPVLHARGRDKGKPKYRRGEGGRYGSGLWTRAYVAKILKDRRALGEHQPRGKGRKPEGEAIKGYFPAVVTGAEFKAARAGAAERKWKPGRTPENYVNVFSGLLRDARGKDSADTYFITTDRGSGRGALRRVLVNNAGAEGRAKYCSFPAEAFERGVFSCLREIDPHEIINGDEGPDEARALTGEHAAVQERIARLEAELVSGDVAALARVLRQLEAQEKDLAARLAAAQEKAAHPLSAAWGEAQTLLQALDSAPDPREARLRLRSALRRIVDAVWLLVVRRGLCRLCAVQIRFAGGERHRDYLILSRQAQGGGRQAATRPGGWWARSLADVAKPGDLDLRRKKDAHELERALLLLDLEGLRDDG
jgi:DNA invertase Pin-like site-specific DNA recombinase